MELATPLDDQKITVPPPSDAAADAERTQTMVRGVFRAVSAAAIVAVAVAATLNWLWLTKYAPVPRTVEAALTGRTAAEGKIPQPATASASALKKLPPTILQYETIARHQVPGAGRGKAEAIYKSLNMDFTIQVPVSVYTAVEIYTSETAARQRASEIMESYPLRQANDLVGGATPAFTGYTEDEGTRAVVWVRDTYVTYSKSTFERGIPEEKRDFLENVQTPVADAVDIFQRTGKSGVEAQASE